MVDIIKKVLEAESIKNAIYTIIGAVVLTFLQAWLVMLLWNWIAVSLFGAPIIGFWVAFGLNWLCSLLFKGKS